MMHEAIALTLTCSRLRDSGEKSFSKKKCEKRAGAGERQGGGACTHFFNGLFRQPRTQGSLLPAPWSERDRDPGKRWSHGSRPKLFLREESFVSHFFVSGLFATFTQLSQQQDRFANPTTTITETKGNFYLNQTIR